MHNARDATIRPPRTVETPPVPGAPAIDGYAIEKVLGRGAEATVYLARELKHGRQVAIKVLKAERAAPVQSERFLREIHTIAGLAHPNVVPLLDSGRVDECLYYVSPYIDGKSLRHRLCHEPRLPVGEAVRIVREIAEGLDYVHRHGVVHRDIKPENILLADGHPMLADFGIARALSVSTLTRKGVGLGTPLYMSPEHAQAPPQVDGRSDVYSLACVLYELLAGSPPFTGNSLEEVLAQHAAAHVPSVRRARPAVSRALEHVILKALAKSPADRYATAEEFAQALAEHRKKKWYVEEAKYRLRHPRSAHALAAAALLVLAGGGLLALRRDPEPDGGLIARRIIVTPLENRTGSPTFDPLGVMVADWATTGLQRIAAVEVVPTPTAIQISRRVMEDRPAGLAARDPVRAMATETGAGIVITGAVYLTGDTLLFRLQVTDVAQGTLIQTLEDVIALVRDPLSGVEEVRARLMGWFAGQYDERIRSDVTEGGRAPTYEAYVAFSEGLDQYTAAEFGKALPRFLQAYRVDSTFSVALLYASLCSWNLGEFARSDSLVQVVARARSSLSDYHRAWLDYRVAFLAGRHEEALTAIRTAARLAPDSKAAYNHAVTAFQAGHPVEALRVLKSISPERGPMRGFLSYWDMLAAVQHSLELYDDERSTGVEERERYPDRLFALAPQLRSMAVRGRASELNRLLDDAESFPIDPVRLDFGELAREAAEELRAHGHPVASRAVFARAYMWHRAADRGPVDQWGRTRAAYALGRFREADSLLALLRAADRDNPDFLGIAGLIHARTGRSDAAMAVADTLSRVARPYQFAATTTYRARIAAALGQPESAVALLRQAFKEGKEFDLWFHRDPDLEVLRNYPPFEELARFR